MSKRFDGLTPAQEHALGNIAIGNDGGWHSKTIAVLLRRGLIVQIGERVVCQDRFGTVTAPVYEMPLAEHMRWCQWCSDNLPEDAA